MSMGMGGAASTLLKEGTNRIGGRECRRLNVTVACIVAELLRSTLGPRGMYKLIVTEVGDVKITCDGTTILRDVTPQNQLAKIMFHAARDHKSEVGDGSTSAILLTGELLSKAYGLTEEKIHPAIIVNGYKKACSKALGILGEISTPVNPENREALRNAIYTALGGRVPRLAKEPFSDCVAKAVLCVSEKRGSRPYVDRDNIQIYRGLLGSMAGSILDTRLINGLIIDPINKEMPHPSMPRRVEGARIALLKCPLELKLKYPVGQVFDVRIQIKDPESMGSFRQEEKRILREMVDKIAATKANVVMTQRMDIDEEATQCLARHGIMAVKRVKPSDMDRLEKATGGKTVANVSDLTESDLGYAELVEERKIGDEKLLFVEGCKDPKAVCIMLRACSDLVLDDLEGALKDAVSVAADIARESRIVAGGGAVEMEVARRLRKYVPSMMGREQLAFQAFAEALEIIPRVLAQNAGLDPLDTVLALRAAHEGDDGVWMGLDAYTGKITDTMQIGVLEPLLVKRQILKTATELASMVLRIDDVILAKYTKPRVSPPPPPPGPFL